MNRACRIVDGQPPGPLRATLIAGVMLTGCTPATGSLHVSTASTLIRQVEGEDRVPVRVTIPVLATPGDARITVLRDGGAVSVASTPSTTLAGGVDLVDDGATFTTTLNYEVTAAFPSGGTARKDVVVSLVRTLLSFPTVNARKSVDHLTFDWSVLGLEGSTFQLDITPSGGPSWSLSFGSAQSSYVWGDTASASATGHLIFPSMLPPGQATARMTATKGPARRREQAISRLITFTP